MDKRGQFFFLQWGKDTKQEQLLGVKLGLKCECKSNKFNVVYNFKKYHLFWVIPLGRWSIETVHLQCLKCGRIYSLEDKLEEQAIDLLVKVKAREELITEGKIKDRKATNLTKK